MINHVVMFKFKPALKDRFGISPPENTTVHQGIQAGFYSYLFTDAGIYRRFAISSLQYLALLKEKL